MQTLVVFFLCFSAFFEFRCHFYKNTFVWTIIMKCFTSFWFRGGLKSIKLEKCFFLPTSNKFAKKKNNPLMQLRLIFYKTLIKTNQKSENLKVLVNLTVFQQLRKLWKEGGGKFNLFSSLFLSVHVISNINWNIIQIFLS